MCRDVATPEVGGLNPVAVKFTIRQIAVKGCNYEVGERSLEWLMNIRWTDSHLEEHSVIWRYYSMGKFYVTIGNEKVITATS